MSRPTPRRLRPPSPVRLTPSDEASDSDGSVTPTPSRAASRTPSEAGSFYTPPAGSMDLPLSPNPGITASSWRGLGRGFRSHQPHGSPDSVDTLVLPSRAPHMDLSTPGGSIAWTVRRPIPFAGPPAVPDVAEADAIVVTPQPLPTSTSTVQDFVLDRSPSVVSCGTHFVEYTQSQETEQTPLSSILSGTRYFWPPQSSPLSPSSALPGPSAAASITPHDERRFQYVGGLGPPPSSSFPPTVPSSSVMPSTPTPWLPEPAAHAYRPRFLDLEREVGVASSRRRAPGRRGRRSAPLGPIGLVRSFPTVVPPTPASPDERRYTTPVNDPEITGPVSPPARQASIPFSDPPAHLPSRSASPERSMPASPPISQAKFNKRLLTEADDIEAEEHAITMAKIESLLETRKTLYKIPHSLSPTGSMPVKTTSGPPAPVIGVKRKRDRSQKGVKISAPAPTTTELDDAPVKRGRGRPPGSKNLKPTKGKGKTASAARASSDAPPATVRLEGVNRGRRPGPTFNFALPVPPIDVDGFSRVLTHHVLRPFFGGCDNCLTRNLQCDDGRIGQTCTPCASRKFKCSNTFSATERTGSWNRLSQRFGAVGNESVNNLLRDLEVFGDRTMDALELARSMYRKFELRQQRLGDVMTQLGYGYGGATGVAHAAEIDPALHEQFAEYWTAGQLSLPPRPSRPLRTPPGPVPRRTWDRQAFPYYTELDDRNDPELPGPEAPNSNSRQGPRRSPGPSAGGTRELRRDDDDDGSDDEESDSDIGREEKRGPPTPPSPYFTRSKRNRTS
ncbi:hypothetical protein GGX14DRAFT_399880 [Mycena pura]|uniref:Zn(2)-C6 fungal-type domain-containing protein n=1 Tax=Mycena pura TaxID=153505 RepID=A0AAD6V3Z6_9AGAR|nr:hypothetical protein GGX14DRAFT_399880 [Mycena pura]